LGHICQTAAIAELHSTTQFEQTTVVPRYAV